MEFSLGLSFWIWFVPTCVTTFSTFHSLRLFLSVPRQKISFTFASLWEKLVASYSLHLIVCCGTINLVILHQKLSISNFFLPYFCCRCFCFLLPDFCLCHFSFVVKLLHETTAVLLVATFLGFHFFSRIFHNSFTDCSRSFLNYTLLSKFVTFYSNILSISLILSERKSFFELTHDLSNSCASVIDFDESCISFYSLCLNY